MAKIKSLSEQVYDYIVYKIKIGELLFDEKINETALIDQLGISRTPIREALIQMSSDGILENIPRKGFFVKSISNQKISEVYKIIGVLDAYWQLRKKIMSCTATGRKNSTLSTLKPVETTLWWKSFKV